MPNKDNSEEIVAALKKNYTEGTLKNFAELSRMAMPLAKKPESNWLDEFNKNFEQNRPITSEDMRQLISFLREARQEDLKSSKTSLRISVATLVATIVGAVIGAAITIGIQVVSG